MTIPNIATLDPGTCGGSFQPPPLKGKYVSISGASWSRQKTPGRLSGFLQFQQLLPKSSWRPVKKRSGHNQDTSSNGEQKISKNNTSTKKTTTHLKMMAPLMAKKTIPIRDVYHINCTTDLRQVGWLHQQRFTNAIFHWKWHSWLWI